jgi:iron complex transport system permease protein
MTNQRSIVVIALPIAIAAVFFGSLFSGSVAIPAGDVWRVLTGSEIEREAWATIIVRHRLPQALTALLAGPALAVSGLMLQTLFRNPLAGPSILGVSEGANLGVGIVMLYLGGVAGRGAHTIGGSLAIILAALSGAVAVLSLIVYFSGKLKSNVMVLIIGIMIGYLASSGIAALHVIASTESIRSYVMWGMGSFSGIAPEQFPVFASAILPGIAGAVLLIKPLNALQLGDYYAANLGVSIRRTRIFVLLCAGLLTAAVTAFCGPVGFIGLAVPHLSRMLLYSSDHKILLPATLLMGAIVAMLCNILTVLPFGLGILPLNAVTPLLGAPVIVYIIVSRKQIQYFN